VQLTTSARHYKRKRKPFVYADKRVKEIEGVMFGRYGDILPDEEIGRRFVTVLANHMGEARRIRALLAEYAPWYDEDDADELIRRVEHHRTKWRADSLAKFLNVTYAERAEHELRTIGACDMPKEERAKIRQERYRGRKRMLDRVWQEKQRRAAGKVTREVYEAASASRLKPWVAAGFKTRRRVLGGTAKNDVGASLSKNVGRPWSRLSW
jgi:hypothetical protein